jgi:hypothetical protein
MSLQKQRGEIHTWEKKRFSKKKQKCTKKLKRVPKN